MEIDDVTSASLYDLSELTQKERVQILMDEYSALRSEIVARTGYGFQIMSVSAVAMTWIATQSESSPWMLFYPVIFLIIVGFATSIYVNTRDLKKAPLRVKEIEAEAKKGTEVVKSI